MRTAFSTPVTPTRESPSRTSGAEAWRSGERRALISAPPGERSTPATGPTTADSPSSSRSPATTCGRRSRPSTASRGRCEQLPLEAPAPRYVEMIDAASAQIDDLVDQLAPRRAYRGRQVRPDAGRAGLPGAGPSGGRAARGGQAERDRPRRSASSSTRSRPPARSRSSPARRRASAATTASRSTWTAPSSSSRPSRGAPGRSCSARSRGSSRRLRRRFLSRRWAARSKLATRRW